MVAQPIEPQAEPAPVLQPGEELATEAQTLYMASLSSRYLEELPPEWHSGFGGPGPPLLRWQASRWLDRVLARHPEARRQQGARLAGVNPPGVLPHGRAEPGGR